MRVKRPLCTVAAAMLLAALPAIANCAPLKDVAPSDWAYHAITSLADRGIIHGYPDGTFKGERAPTRSEMAALLSRAVARSEADAAPKADLEQTGHLIDALKDELDALSVRVTRIEERLGTSQQPSAARQPLIRRVSARDAIKNAADLSVRQAVARADMALLTARAIADIQSRDASKDDVEQAHGRISALSEKLDLLSVRVTNLDALRGGEERPQPMMRVTHRSAAALLDEAGSMVWARWLESSPPGSLAGIAFQAPAGDSSAQYSPVGRAIFGVGTVPSAVPAAIAESDGVQPILGTRYALKDRASFLYEPSVGGALNARSVPALPASRDALRLAIPIALAPSFGLSADQITAPGAGAAPNPALNAVPTLTVPLTGSLAPYVRGPEGATVQSPDRSFQAAVPLQVGTLRMQSNFGLAHLQGLDRADAATQSCSILPALCAAAFGRGSFSNELNADTSFDVRALGRHVSLNVGGSYGLLHRPAGTALPYVPYDPATDNLDLPAAATLTPVTFDPNYVDVLKRTLNAAAAVPISPDLMLNLQYNTEYYTGSYQAFGQSIQERKDAYLGNLTYTIPRTSNTIVFSAKQYHYRDAFLPTYNLTQNRADLNFTIKF